MAERWRVTKPSPLEQIKKWLFLAHWRWSYSKARVRLVVAGALCAVVALSVAVPLILRADRIVGQWTSVRKITAASASALPPGDFWESMALCVGEVHLVVAEDQSFFWEAGGRRVEGAWKAERGGYTTCDISFDWYGRAWITKKGTLFWSQTDLASLRYVLYAFYKD